MEGVEWLGRAPPVRLTRPIIANLRWQNPVKRWQILQVEPGSVILKPL
jgi:hypothetical protein